MIGHIFGEVLFSDGNEVIILSNSGIGYQIFYNKVLSEGSWVSLYISHVIKEASEELYGFKNLRSKKLFEMLIQVKGVGPKSAFSLLKAIDANQICQSILLEDKKILTQAPGIGTKAAAQLILDLSGKIHKVKMYSESSRRISKANTVYQQIPGKEIVIGDEKDHFENDNSGLVESSKDNEHQMILDAVMACKGLGFKEDAIIPLARKVLDQNEIGKVEQLVHLVLKEI